MVHPRVSICAALLGAFAAGAPCAFAVPAYQYVVTPSIDHSAVPGSPVIRRVELNKQHFSSHDQIRMRVITSSNVTTVRNHELGHGGMLHKLSRGVFVGKGQVSGIPFFLKGMKVAMHFTATTASGEATTATASVTF